MSRCWHIGCPGRLSRPKHVKPIKEGCEVYGSEILSAASPATCGDVAFSTLFERDDVCHARLRTRRHWPTFRHRVRPGRSHCECHCHRNRQSNETLANDYD